MGSEKVNQGQEAVPVVRRKVRDAPVFDAEVLRKKLRRAAPEAVDLVDEGKAEGFEEVTVAYRKVGVPTIIRHDVFDLAKELKASFADVVKASFKHTTFKDFSILANTGQSFGLRGRVVISYPHEGKDILTAFRIKIVRAGVHQNTIPRGRFKAFKQACKLMGFAVEEAAGLGTP